MIRRLHFIAIGAALLASGCATHLGRGEPACGLDSVSSSIIISAQSIAGAEYVPCINDLKPGWTYQHLEARSGQSRFWLSSDRVGQRFLEVTLEESCDLSEAIQIDSDEPGIDLYVQDIVDDFHVRVTVVPEGGGEVHRDYGAEIVAEIGATRSGNRLVEAAIDDTDLPTAERIRLAHSTGRSVLVVGSREYEEGTVELHRLNPNGSVTVLRGIDAEEAIEEIRESLGDPVYRAKWLYPFDNGCVTYRFDAKGAGVERIARDVSSSLGFTPLAPIREYGEQVGYYLP